ncbi:MAG: ATP-dependent DNA helicase RecG [Clostridiales bacterium]|nr:ATP-dependent DNA helicase RecG [Clostridiales bacterium]
MGMGGPVTDIKGVGKKKAESLKKLGIERIEDFFYFYPREYQDRRSATKIAELPLGQFSLIRATVAKSSSSYSPYRRKSVLRLLVSDGTASLEVVFFNASYLTGSFTQGVEYFFYGKATADGGKLQMAHPEFTAVGGPAENGIVPVYPLTAGVSQLDMRKWQRAAAAFAAEADEYLPADIIGRNRLCGIQHALENIHFPKDGQKLKEARYRLVFDELFFLQTGLLYVKPSGSASGGIEFSKGADIERYVAALPYRLTGAQERVVGEIIRDMESPKAMNRLVQGDVGCGKTAVAAIALFKACMSGYQGVLMAPTELLASQHYSALKGSFSAFGAKVSLLLGSMGAKEKKETLKALEEGETDILIGTHAIIQPGVKFKNLGLVITDEQHRFGVNQRMKLTQKGDSPDVLVMSATPIPRTLAMIIYGDLDISAIDELPPGRQKTTTLPMDSSMRGDAYGLLRREVASGRQAYVVAPLIDDSEAIDARSAESICMELKKQFSGYSVALLHGDMKQVEKDSVMRQFYGGDIDVLVSTVVVEVGINVPNATVMLIENAERFGLAQLHQLRGRVGRGSEKSYCILVTENETVLAAERAQAMARTQDGFEIAEMDLALRGPGEFFGVRQHGLPDLRIANLLKHAGILETVREEARRLLAEDSDLSLPGHRLLKEKIQKQFDLTL